MNIAPVPTAPDLPETEADAAAVASAQARAPAARQALYAATMLVPLTGFAMFALGALLSAGRMGSLASLRPVQDAEAQEVTATPAPPAAEPTAAPPAPADAAPAASVAPAPREEGDALSALIDQANFWRGKLDDAQAITSLNRALKLAPDNTDALALLAEVEVEHGDRRAAADALTRLRQVAPADPRIPRIDQAIRIGAISPEALAEARRLAQGGKQAEAVDRYNRVLKGTPPTDALAVEYYQTLVGVPGGYDTAREGLARLVRQNPNDLRAQLAYAQTLTYRDETRAEGIARLAALAPHQAIAGQAAQSWRQALNWLPDAPESEAALQSYLETHPGDTDLAAKLERVRNPLLNEDPATRARVEGFDALNKGKLPEAAALFQQAIDANVGDSDAIGGLGLVRLRQRNMAEAKTLLSRAITLDPEHKSQWQSALTAASLPPPAVAPGPNPASAMLSRGDFAGAERELKRQVAQGGDSAGLLGMLGDAQAGLGKLDEAETSYRGALARAPNNAQVEIGLAGVLSRLGRDQEAAALLAQAEASGDKRIVAQARGAQLREQANATQDPMMQLSLLQAAVGADPANPWLRLDLARLLARIGQMPQARGVMDEVTRNSPSTDALRAGILFANETGDPDTASALIARLPASLRTVEMRSAQQLADLQRQIAIALAAPPDLARQRLLALAEHPDPDGGRGAAIARAFGQLGDRGAARSAILAAQASSPGQSPAALLRYAGALLEIGAASGASDMLAQIGPARGLTAAQHNDYVKLQAGLAVRNSDQLNEQGKQAEAYDRLAPVLAQAPENPDLNLALARLYQGAKNPREALTISQSLLQRQPGNMEARKGAVEAALQLGDRKLAESLVQDGLQIAPNDPQAWIMSADLAKANGRTAQALRDLEHARALRMRQLGYADNGAGGAALPQSYPSAPPQAASPPGSTADLGADQPTDLSVPPMIQQRAVPPAPADPAPPFSRAPVNAVGTPPSYDPNSAYAPPHPLLDTTPVTLPPPGQVAPPAPAYQQPAYPQPQYQAPAYAPPAYAPQAYPQPYPQQPYPPQGYPQPYPAPPYQPYPQQPYAVAPRYPAPQPGLRPGYYENPFRPTPSDPLSEAEPVTPQLTIAQTDPVTAQIDKSIVELRDSVAPSVQAGFGFRDRSGDSGLDKLDELTIPMEATFTPGGVGQLKLSVTPTLLTGGTLGGDINNQQRFGTNALLLRPPVPGSTTQTTTSLAGTPAGDQSADGIGLGVAYQYRSVDADVGTTPLGFRRENLLGGVEWTPSLSEHMRLRLTAERRAVSDSLLSYAGAVDPRTGSTWGGVTRDHARANLEFSAGKADLYVGGGGAELEGSHVANNTEYEFGTGGSVPVWTSPTQEVRLGLDLVYFSYQKNLRFFTLGQGGYFSPQSFYAAMVPVEYKEKLDEDFSYEVGGSLGFESYHEKASPYYPIDSGLEGQLVAQQADPNTAVPGVLTEYPSRGQSGIAGTAHVTGDYRVSPSLHLGGKLTYQHSPNFSETTALVYARYLFNGADD